MAVLEVRVRDQVPVRYPLRWGEIVIGRNAEADLCLPLPAVSGRHAILQLQVRLRDLGSTNGTLIEGERVEDCVVTDGTPIEIGRDGSIQLQILFDDALAPGPAEQATLLSEAQPVTRAREASVADADDDKDDDVGDGDGDATRIRSDNKQDRNGHSPAHSAAPSAAEGATPQHPAETQRLRERVRELEQQLANASIDSSKPRVTVGKSTADVGAEEAGQTHLFSRLGELQEKLHREQNARSAAESKLKVLSHSGFSGAQEALQLVQEQRQRIEDLETTLEIAQRRADRLESGSGSDTTLGSIARDDLLTHLQKEMGFDSTMAEHFASRESFPSDCGYLLGRLYGFSRDIERVVTRLAQRYRGGIASADQTIMPGAVGNLSQSVHGLLVRGNDHHRTQLQETLSNLRIWCGICLTAYEQGAKRWSQEFLQRITPQQIQQQVGHSFLKRALALEGWECWKHYREVMRDVTADIAQDQIDDQASRAASEMAEREGAW